MIVFPVIRVAFQLSFLGYAEHRLHRRIDMSEHVSGGGRVREKELNPWQKIFLQCRGIFKHFRGEIRRIQSRLSGADLLEVVTKFEGN